ncbi:MAG: hypothetical protein AAF570_08650 [Bacteroidota bacterium]
MAKPSDIEQEVAQTLALAEAIEQVPSNPFLREKIMRRIAEELPARRPQARRRFALQLAATVLLVLVNAFTVLNRSERASGDGAISNAKAPIEAFMDEYGISSSRADMNEGGLQ